ncbi:hypothetical protein NHX12_003219 [Muraenolepis orangiensis]|uniref:Uncharacterized protein n=1 Tax=Muraenolepis orangiensis TaxID=630683 RepID=A0A9Q0DYK1_9TELE|nr:hypothetical protein NHX12_003219 [Muraenolepis orangiensis]
MKVPREGEGAGGWGKSRTDQEGEEGEMREADKQPPFDSSSIMCVAAMGNADTPISIGWEKNPTSRLLRPVIGAREEAQEVTERGPNQPSKGGLETLCAARGENQQWPIVLR